MNVYLEKQDIPNKCTKCFFINSNDECILQDDDANFMADTWDDLLRNCPLKEVEQVKHGWWKIAEDGDGVVCSHCGKDFCILVYETDDFKYCPNCGTLMDKEE